MTTSPSPTPIRNLRRSNENRTVGGVCGGVGRYFGVDPVLVRLVWLVAAIAGGVGFVAYMVAWVVIPSDDGTSVTDTAPSRFDELDTPDNRRIAGVAFVVLAIAMLSGGHWLTDGVLLPVALVGLGFWLVMRNRSEAESSDGPLLWSPSPRHPDPPSWTSSPERSSPRDRNADADLNPETTSDPTNTTPGTDPLGDTAQAGSGDDEVDRLLAAAAAYEQGDHLLEGLDEHAGAPVTTATDRRRGPSLTLPALGVIAVAVAVAGVATRIGLISPSATTALALIVGALGTLLIAGAFVGRVRGLIVVGVILTVMLLASFGIDAPFRGGFGDQTIVVTSVDDLAPRYRLGAGELVLDLRSLEPFVERTVLVKASLTAGSLEVLVGDGVRVRGTATADLGEVTVPTKTGPRAAEGVGIDLAFDHGTGSGIIEFDLDVGFGEINVIAR